MNTFKHNHPHKDVEALVRVVNSVHDKRMVKDEEEAFEVTEDDFEELLKRLEKKNKRSYESRATNGLRIQPGMIQNL